VVLPPVRFPSSVLESRRSLWLPGHRRDINVGKVVANSCGLRRRKILHYSLSAHLKSSGFPVEVASDGVEALQQIQQEKFDLLLMDITTKS
jgi:hypothetical protein